MKTEIINNGTTEFPFYTVMVDSEEYCSTGDIKKAENIVNLLSIHIVSSSNNFKKTLVCKDGTTWYLTDKEVEAWEKDGSIKKGDKLYRTITDTLY